jgi:predicted dinucleotide-utilizing enzyme
MDLVEAVETKLTVLEAGVDAVERIWVYTLQKGHISMVMSVGSNPNVVAMFRSLAYRTSQTYESSKPHAFS